MGTRAVLVVNGGSRRSAELAGPARLALEAAGIEIAEFIECAPDETETKLSSLRDRSGLVLVGGGDGTLGLAAGVFAGTEVTVGFLPFGTGNQLTKELGIPSDLEKAAQALASGKVVALDVARINGRAFMTVATVGLTTEIARNLVLKKQIGKLAYIPAAIKAAIRTEPFLYSLFVVGGETKGTAVQIVIGNGRSHAGPFWTAPDASLVDGNLTCYTVGPMSGREGAVTALFALVGTQNLLEGVNRFSGQAFKLSTQPPLPVVIDGEEAWFDSIEATIEPGALRALVPARYPVPAERLVQAALTD